MNKPLFIYWKCFALWLAHTKSIVTLPYIQVEIFVFLVSTRASALWCCRFARLASSLAWLVGNKILIVNLSLPIFLLLSRCDIFISVKLKNFNSKQHKKQIQRFCREFAQVISFCACSTDNYEKFALQAIPEEIRIIVVKLLCRRKIIWIL